MAQRIGCMIISELVLSVVAALAMLVVGLLAIVPIALELDDVAPGHSSEKRQGFFG